MTSVLNAIDGNVVPTLSSPNRSISAPPDVELSSTNVFSFGLKNYTGFHTGEMQHENNHGGGGGGEITSHVLNHTTHSIRQPLVDDQPNGLWSSSPSSARSRISNGTPQHQQQQHQHSANGVNGFGSQHASPFHSRTNSHDHNNNSLHSSANGEDLQHQIQHAANTLEALSLKNGADGLHTIAEPSQSNNLLNNNSITNDPAMNNNADLNNYLYTLSLQQSLLSSLNLSQLSPAQLALLQQQMQRLPPTQETQTQKPSNLQQLYEQQAMLQMMQLQQQQQQQFRYSNNSNSRGGFNKNNGSSRDAYGDQRYNGNNHKQRRGDDRLGLDNGLNGGGRPRQNGYNNTKYGQTKGNGYQPHNNHNGNNNNRSYNSNSNYRHNGGGMYENGNNMHGENKLVSPHHRSNSPLDTLDRRSHHHAQHQHQDTDSLSMNSNGDYTATTTENDLVSQFSTSSTLEELTGHIYLLSKDQYGCRLLQRMLDEAVNGGKGDGSTALIDLIYTECYDHVNELLTDSFANYLTQKLIEYCDEEQRLSIIQKASNDLVSIALNMHGTRAVQKLVETIHTSAEIECVINALKSSVVTLIKDLNGNHVIQRCLHHLSAKDNQFIYDAVSRHCVSVATHKHGCCVLQRCIDYATIPQKRQLITEICNNALELVQDAFGNYVVQYILDLGEASITHGVVNNLLGHISSLSVQKFSSNVVEKCLELSNDKMKSKMIEELIHIERLPRLLQDPYANYVIQKALSVSKKNQFERLVNVIKPHLITLRNTSFGKRIQHKIMKKFPHLGITMDLAELGITSADLAEIQQHHGGGGQYERGGYHGQHQHPHQQPQQQQYQHPGDRVNGSGRYNNHIHQTQQQQQQSQQQPQLNLNLLNGFDGNKRTRSTGAAVAPPLSPTQSLQQSLLFNQQLALQQQQQNEQQPQQMQSSHQRTPFLDMNAAFSRPMTS